jgi:hypothetical protein
MTSRSPVAGSVSKRLLETSLKIRTELRFLKTENKCARFAELKQKTTIAVYVHLFWGKHKCTTSANSPPGLLLYTFFFTEFTKIGTLKNIRN